MRSFFSSFFASLLALIIFSLLVFFFFVAVVGRLGSSDRPVIRSGSVLVLDLSQHFSEQMREGPLSVLRDDEVPGLYDVIRLMQEAAADKDVAGLYIKANGNGNGFASSEEIREAIAAFKRTGKFVMAHGDMITQQAYSVANIADRIYASPQGYFDWTGYSVEYLFLKGTLEKLEIEPQIFYAGKFKSATEPLRADRMSPENQLQTSVWLNDLYNTLLLRTAESRNIDTSTLRILANEGRIQTARDAVANKLIDDVKYDDQVRDEIKSRLKLGKYDRISFVTLSTYKQARKISSTSGEKIALIYAEGNIVDGEGDQSSIGAEKYRSLIRKARLDKAVKAIVLRINSGGGSSLASEHIWRELYLAKQDKPVIVSFGDVAASGGYYIACAADSIFAQPGTITGSIGVFGIIPNMQSFFKNKLGITFDGVKTGPYADAGAVYRPLDEKEKQFLQANIDDIYRQFKQRVGEGRKLDTSFVDSIAQGRVWTGARAVGIGLVDRFGGVDDAVRSAAQMAKLKSWHVSEYPETENFLEQLFNRTDPMNYTDKVKQEIGEENYKIYQEIKSVKEMSGTIQARIPFRYIVR